jgi:hypothetical protein
MAGNQLHKGCGAFVLDLVAQAHILQVRPIDEWLPHRVAYLDEMIRHDGRNGHSSKCSQCSDQGDYKCRDCAFGKYYCKACIMEHHAFLPLHRLLVVIATFNFRLHSLTVGLALDRHIPQGYDAQESRIRYSAWPCWLALSVP